MLDRDEAGPVAGDLDDLGEEAFGIRDGKRFDDAHDPTTVDTDDEDDMWIKRWEFFQEKAAAITFGDPDSD